MKRVIVIAVIMVALLISCNPYTEPVYYRISNSTSATDFNVVVGLESHQGIVAGSTTPYYEFSMKKNVSGLVVNITPLGQATPVYSNQMFIDGYRKYSIVIDDKLPSGYSITFIDDGE